MRIKPANNRMVRKPFAPFALLDPAGENVTPDQYWLRRMAAGDVVPAPDDDPATATPDPVLAAPSKGENK